MHLEDSGRSACVRTEGSVLEGMGKLKDSSCLHGLWTGTAADWASTCIKMGKPTNHPCWNRIFLNNKAINKLVGRWDHSLHTLHCHRVPASTFLLDEEGFGVHAVAALAATWNNSNTLPATPFGQNSHEGTACGQVITWACGSQGWELLMRARTSPTVPWGVWEMDVSLLKAQIVAWSTSNRKGTFDFTGHELICYLNYCISSGIQKAILCL